MSSTPGPIETVSIGAISLSYKGDDGGGKHYRQRSHVEEYFNPLYRLIEKKISPSICIDVGANYGYTGLLMKKNFPNSDLHLIEPTPWLCDFIKLNFKNNNQAYTQLHERICSSETSENPIKFGSNEKSSQDSRVIPQSGFKIISTKSISLADILRATKGHQGVFIKIDTQGWEPNVFSGGDEFLASHQKWLIKTEFAPQWLLSQGSNPVDFLKSIIEKYNVHESLGRAPWNCRSLKRALGKPLKAGCEVDFADYVTNLNSNERGWIDLYVTPKLLFSK